MGSSTLFGAGLWSQAASHQILPRPGCVTVDQSLHLSEPPVLTWRVGGMLASSPLAVLKSRKSPQRRGSAFLLYEHYLL